MCRVRWLSVRTESIRVSDPVSNTAASFALCPHEIGIDGHTFERRIERRQAKDFLRPGPPHLLSKDDNRILPESRTRASFRTTRSSNCRLSRDPTPLG